MDVERFNRAARLHRSGRLSEAEAIYRTLPDHPVVRMRLCQALLAQAKLPEGLKLYEDRFSWPVGAVPAISCPFPRWEGQEVSSLLILPEQGLGDQIQFARYAPPWATLCAPAPLVRLFAGLGCRVVPVGERVERHEAWAPICSMGHLVGGLPPTPYLSAEGTGGGIGVVWKGAPGHPNDANRSMPSGDLLLSLPDARSLHPEDTGAADMQDTADIIAGLDLVVSVDTSVVHLAGAMGKPCWVLLPALNPDWRWTRGDRTPWYPTVRLFRQSAPGDWASVVEIVREVLDRAGVDDQHAARASCAGRGP